MLKEFQMVVIELLEYCGNFIRAFTEENLQVLGGYTPVQIQPCPIVLLGL